MSIKSLQRKLETAEAHIEELENKIVFQSIILNKVRNILMSHLQWNGLFENRDVDLSDVLERLLNVRANDSIDSPK